MSLMTKTTSTMKVSRPGVSSSLPPVMQIPSFKNLCSPGSPPSPVCKSLNDQVRSDPMCAYPDFDFQSYMGRRSYTLSTIDFGRSTGASFLDDDVHNIVAGLLSQIPPPGPSVPPSYEIRNAREKGSGIFATSIIPSGSPVFDEHPAIIIPYLLGISVPLAEMLTELFETLPKSAFALATSLATSHQDDPKPEPSTSSASSLPPPSFYEDIMQTNSVGINLMVPENASHHEIATHRGLFLLLSRCNHSCNPNATWSWDPSTLTLTLTASRPISPGEEITISYIPLSGDHAADKVTLKEAYGFDCTCEECTLPSYTAANSNAVVCPVSGSCLSDDDDEEIKNLPTFEAWLADPTLPDLLLINAHKDALCLIEERENMSSHFDSLDSPVQSTILAATEKLMDHHVEVIGMCYGALGDVPNFRKWIAVTKEGLVRPEEKRVLNRWLSNPSSFPLWCRRPYSRRRGKPSLPKN